MAGVIQYGKVFRQKNAIINMIEQNEGVFSLGSRSDTAEDETIYGFARKAGYNRDLSACMVADTYRGEIYKIEISYGFQMPMVGEIPMTVRGETKLIQRPEAYNNEGSGIPNCN